MKDEALMPNRTKSDPLAAALKRTGFTVRPVQMTLVDDGRPIDSTSIRVVLPDQGAWSSAKRPKGFEWMSRGNILRHYYVSRLVLLLGVADDPRRRNGRILGAKGLYHTTSIREAWKTTSLKLRVPDVVRRLATNPTGSDEELLLRALYPRPLAPFEADDDQYEAFVDEVLAHVDAEQEKNGGRLTDEDLRARFRHASRVESSRSKLLTAIASEAGVLLRAAEPLGPRKSAPDAWRSADQAIGEYLTLVARALRQAEMDCEPWAASLLTEIEWAAGRRTTRRTLGLLAALEQDLRDRAPLLECLLREVDLAPSYFTGREMREVYRQLRRHLTPAERRLFILMYVPDLPVFGSPVPSLPFAGRCLFTLPFFQAMLCDVELAGLTVWVIGHRKRRIRGEDIAAQLHRLYRQYVAFYAWWSQQVRFDDAERKRSQRRIKRESTVGFLEDRLEGGVVEHDPDQLTKVVEALVRQIEAAQVPRRTVTVASKYFLDRRTQSEIAAELGIRQQTVAKQISKVIDKYLQPLLSTAGIDAREYLKKSGVLRRGRRPGTR